MGLKGLVRCSGAIHVWGGWYLGWSRMGAQEIRPGREVLIGLNQVLVVGPRVGPLSGRKLTSSTHPQGFLGPLVEMAR